MSHHLQVQFGDLIASLGFLLAVHLAGWGSRLLLRGVTDAQGDDGAKGEAGVLGAAECLQNPKNAQPMLGEITATGALALGSISRL